MQLECRENFLWMRSVRIESDETRGAARYEASDTAGKDQHTAEAGRYTKRRSIQAGAALISLRPVIEPGPPPGKHPGKADAGHRPLCRNGRPACETIGAARRSGPAASVRVRRRYGYRPPDIDRAIA